jgi:hypothetical protein
MDTFFDLAPADTGERAMPRFDHPIPTSPLARRGLLAHNL